jgi:hypothetical protein
MSGPAAAFGSVVVLCIAAIVRDYVLTTIKARGELALTAYRAESIEANKELERQRHRIAELEAALERAGVTERELRVRLVNGARLN